jgi:hypothetical protein
MKPAPPVMRIFMNWFWLRPDCRESRRVAARQIAVFSSAIWRLPDLISIKTY